MDVHKQTIQVLIHNLYNTIKCHVFRCARKSSIPHFAAHTIDTIKFQTANNTKEIYNTRLLDKYLQSQLLCLFMLKHFFMVISPSSFIQ
jgi:hypothetical protein